jgi:regulator of cell morphogenesis and NO signaling
MGKEEAMKVDPGQAVGEIALKHREVIPILERFGIDYYSEGSQSLKDACFVRCQPIEEVRAELEKALPAGEGDKGPDWSKESVQGLVEHIVDEHHAFTRDRLDRAERSLEALAKGPEGKEMRFLALQDVVRHLASELRDHMDREEETLFPLLVREEQARLSGDPSRVLTPGGALCHELDLLLSDHGLLGREWRMIERLTDGMRPPSQPGPLADLHRVLRELEMDNHRHIHLEHNILYKRAVQWGLLEGPARPGERT